MNFDIKTEQLGDDAYVIALAGEVDLYTAPEFKQQLLEVIAQGGKDVIVDFSDTTFIDSTTLGVLVGGVKRLRTQDGQLSLVCSDRNITKIFEITGLDRVFTIYPTRDEAISSVNAPTQPSAAPMPHELGTGGDAASVAAYVASVAGTGPAREGAAPTLTTTTRSGGGGGGGGGTSAAGATLFENLGCSGCHSLSGARLTGPPLNG